MSRKILVTAIVIVVLAFVGALMWFFFLSPGTQTGGERAGEGGGFFGFLSFGGGGGDERPLLPEGAGANLPPEDEQAGRTAELVRLTNMPIAGAIATTTKRGLVVRYLERQTGNVYDVSPDGSVRTRITNTTIPAVREAFFNARGDAVLLRYLNNNDVIRTFGARIAAANDEGGEESPGFEDDASRSAVAPGETLDELVGGFFDDDITFVAPSPDGTEIFYLTPLGSGVIGTTASFTGAGRDQLFDSPFIEWLPQWPEERTVSLTTKASAYADGFLYFFDLKKGLLHKVLGDIPGLTTLVNPDADRAVYAASAEGSFTFHLFDTESHESVLVPLTTLPEKCVWSTKDTAILYCGVPSIIPKNPYPDVWYQGLMSFSDTLWRINTETSGTRLLAVPQSIAREDIDVVNPFLDPSETYLFFTDKTDSALWSVKLTP